MNNIPEKIYLQIGEDCDADSFDELSTEDITWAADNIFPNDIEYTLPKPIAGGEVEEKIEAITGESDQYREAFETNKEQLMELAAHAKDLEAERDHYKALAEAAGGFAEICYEHGVELPDSDTAQLLYAKYQALKQTPITDQRIVEGL